MSDEKNDYPQYEDGILAYIDILGFSKYICSHSDIRFVAGWFKMMDKFRTYAQIVPPGIQGIPGDELQFSQSQTKMVFSSDSFVVTNPCKSRAAFFAVQNYCEYIRKFVFIQFHSLIRGAITTGKFYICDNILFGPAVVDAASKDVSGSPPRILVNRKLEEEIDLAQMYVFTDIDGELCLDMFGWELAESLTSANGKPNGKQKLKEELQGQRDHVTNLLKKYSKTKHVSKYLWYAMAFNQHVAENIYPHYSEIAHACLIDIPLID